MLAGEMQDGAARDEDRQPRRPREEPDEARASPRCTCSALSSRSSSSWERRASASASSGSPATSAIPTAWAIVGTTSSGSRSGASSTSDDAVRVGRPPRVGRLRARVGSCRFRPRRSARAAVRLCARGAPPEPRARASRPISGFGGSGSAARGVRRRLRLRGQDPAGGSAAVAPAASAPGSSPSSSSQPPPESRVVLQRLRLASGAVEREHRLPLQPLAQRVLRRKRERSRRARPAADRARAARRTAPRARPAAAPPAARPRAGGSRRTPGPRTRGRARGSTPAPRARERARGSRPGARPRSPPGAARSAAASTSSGGASSA